MEKALVDLLLATSTITALTGADRITWGTRKKAAGLPALVLNIISVNPVYSDDGFDGLTETRVQIDCWASSWASMRSLSDIVVTLLSGARVSAGGVLFRHVELDRKHEAFEKSDNDNGLHRSSLDFLIWH